MTKRQCQQIISEHSWYGFIFYATKNEKRKSKKLQIRYYRLLYIESNVTGTDIVIGEIHKELEHPVHRDGLKAYYSDLDVYPYMVQDREMIIDDDDDENMDTNNDESQEHASNADGGDTSTPTTAVTRIPGRIPNKTDTTTYL